MGHCNDFDKYHWEGKSQSERDEIDESMFGKPLRKFSGYSRSEAALEEEMLKKERGEEEK